MLLGACLLNLSTYSQHKISTILENGSPEELYNIVVVAEAFTEEEMPEFERLANKIPEVLKLNPTYAKLLDKINIYAVHTPSVDNAITLKALKPSAKDPIQETIQKDTYFGIYFQNSYRAYYLDNGISMKARKVAASHIPFTDNVIIMVNGKNNKRISGRATIELGVSTFGINNNFESNWEKYLLIHELAHALGGLSDGYAGGKSEGFNNTIINDPEKIRWKDFLKEEGVGIEKANDSYDVYIPNRDCVMTWGNYDYFCPVCSARLEDVVTTPKNERLLDIHKTDRRIIDDENHIYEFSWLPVENAQQYDFTYSSNYFDENGNAKSESQVITTTEPFVTIDIDTFYKSYSDNMSVRAYNNQTSSNFTRANVNLYMYNTQDIQKPEINISEITETSCKISWTETRYSETATIRLSNKYGNVVEFTIEGNEISLDNLKEGEEYTVQIAALDIDATRHSHRTSDFSDPVKIQLKESVNVSQAALYPNPSSTFIKVINMPDLKEGQRFDIYNEQGVNVRENRRFSSEKQFGVRKLPKGRYFLKIENGPTLQFEKN